MRAAKDNFMRDELQTTRDDSQPIGEGVGKSPSRGQERRKHLSVSWEALLISWETSPSESWEAPLCKLRGMPV